VAHRLLHEGMLSRSGDHLQGEDDIPYMMIHTLQGTKHGWVDVCGL
jgi:hypothetical protein